jgi:ATP-dependent HslUV protease ATP-binding subunit HslU
VGRDVESIIRDLVDIALKMTREEEMAKVRHRAEDAAEERILDILLPRPRAGVGFSAEAPEQADSDTRQKLRKRLREGGFDDKEIEVEVSANPIGVEIMAPPGMEDMTNQLQSLFANMGGGRTKTRKLRVAEALKVLTEEEAARW